MISRRYAAALTALALAAAACGGSSSSNSVLEAESADVAETADTPPVVEEVDGPAPSTDAAPDPTAEPAPDLFSPTDSTDPFDLSGGATSSDEGVEVVTFRGQGVEVAVVALRCAEGEVQVQRRALGGAGRSRRSTSLGSSFVSTS